MRKQKLGWLSAFLVAFAGITGACSGDGNATPQANRAKEQHEIRVKQTIPDSELSGHPRATAARLEQLAKEIPEVKHANCVIFGKTAIVGIDVGGDVERSRVGTIKYAVAEALRQDPVGIDAIVTADMDLNHRLQEIRGDMANGRLMNGIAEEMADIIGRIIPQLPRDTEDSEAVPKAPGATTQKEGSRAAGSSKAETLDPSKSGASDDNVSGAGNRKARGPDANQGM